MTAPAAERQQAAQTGLTLVAAQQLEAALPRLDLHNLDGTVPGFTRIVQAIAARYGAGAATLAVQHYQQQRAAAGLGPFRAVPADPAAFNRVQSTVEWAVSSLYGPEPDVQAFQRNLQLGVGKLVQDTGRDTILDNVHRDRQAKGWARIPEPAKSASGTCAFCAMLAARGAVYRSQRTARFKAHDGCNCHPEPIFTAYEPSARVRQWQADWRRVTQGRSSADARAAFRQHIEGRPVTGLTRGPNRPAEHGPVKVTRTQAADLIAQLEAANRRAAGNPELARMVAANRARIVSLQAV